MDLKEMLQGSYATSKSLELSTQTSLRKYWNGTERHRKKKLYIRKVDCNRNGCILVHNTKLNIRGKGNKQQQK